MSETNPPNSDQGEGGEPQERDEDVESKKKDWLDSSDYIFPGLLEVYKEMELEEEKHRQAMGRLQERIEEIKSSEQGQFNKLLTAEGRELQEAVIKALK